MNVIPPAKKTITTTTNITKISWRFYQAKYHRWEFLLSRLPIKKMITEVLLVLPLYLILFFIWRRFQPLIKAMSGVGDTLNNDDFFDTVDTPKESIDQYKKRESLKGIMNRGKAYLLGSSKWTYEKVDKASDETTNKTYAEYKQRELDEKGDWLLVKKCMLVYFVSRV